MKIYIIKKLISINAFEISILFTAFSAPIFFMLELGWPVKGYDAIFSNIPLDNLVHVVLIIVCLYGLIFLARRLVRLEPRHNCA